MKGWMTKDFFGGQLQCNETQSRLVVDVIDVFVAQLFPNFFFVSWTSFTNKCTRTAFALLTKHCEWKVLCELQDLKMSRFQRYSPPLTLSLAMYFSAQNTFIKSPPAVIPD